MGRSASREETGARVRVRRGRLRRAGFALAATVLALIVIDQAFGVYLRRNWITKIIGPDPVLVARLKPGAEANYQVGQMTGELWADNAPRVSIRINEDGYRGPRVAREKAPGEFRVICLGDSITMAMDVDEEFTFATQLERMLEERMPGRKVTVINAGVLGYSSRQGLYLFKEKFPDYRSDLVIWGFGFNDQGHSPILGARDIDLIALGPGEAPRFPAWKRKLLLGISNRPLVQGIYGLITPILWKTQAVPLLVKLARDGTAPDFKPTPEQFENARVPPRDFEIDLLEMSRLAQTHHFRLVVVRLFGTNDLYGDTAKRFCQDHGASYVDISTVFTATLASPDALAKPPYKAMFDYYRPSLSDETLRKFPMMHLTTDNLHPNNLGHHLIAVTLAHAIAPEAEDK